jgi:hypothetical protein
MSNRKFAHFGRFARFNALDQEALETRRLTDVFVKDVFDNSGLLSSSSGRFGSPGEIRTPFDGVYLVALPE